MSIYQERLWGITREVIAMNEMLQTFSADIYIAMKRHPNDRMEMEQELVRQVEVLKNQVSVLMQPPMVY